MRELLLLSAIEESHLPVYLSL
jgi:hypothetical protein